MFPHELVSMVGGRINASNFAVKANEVNEVASSKEMVIFLFSYLSSQWLHHYEAAMSSISYEDHSQLQQWKSWLLLDHSEKLDYLHDHLRWPKLQNWMNYVFLYKAMFSLSQHCIRLPRVHAMILVRTPEKQKYNEMKSFLALWNGSRYSKKKYFWLKFQIMVSKRHWMYPWKCKHFLTLQRTEPYLFRHTQGVMVLVYIWQKNTKKKNIGKHGIWKQL